MTREAHDALDTIDLNRMQVSNHLYRNRVLNSSMGGLDKENVEGYSLHTLKSGVEPTRPKREVGQKDTVSRISKQSLVDINSTVPASYLRAEAPEYHYVPGNNRISKPLEKHTLVQVSSG